VIHAGADESELETPHRASMTPPATKSIKRSDGGHLQSKPRLGRCDGRCLLVVGGFLTFKAYVSA
jgi:hypothetical protein